MKKTVENIAGGTKTTITKPGGSKTIIYDGVNNLQIGSHFTYNIPSASFRDTSDYKSSKHPSSSRTNSSSCFKTGVTIQTVDKLQLNANQLNKIFSSSDHKTYATSEEYLKSEQNSENNQSQQSYPSSFKR